VVAKSTCPCHSRCKTAWFCACMRSRTAMKLSWTARRSPLVTAGAARCDRSASSAKSPRVPRGYFKFTICWKAVYLVSRERLGSGYCPGQYIRGLRAPAFHLCLFPLCGGPCA
jgi:hypothetical protein